MLVGCKVTLRKDNLEDFLDSLILASPRMERYIPATVLKIIKKKLKMKSNFFLLKLSELLFFYPIELGLGINSEVRKVELTFIFNTLSIEEKLFLLTSKKIPVKNEN
jgi:ribosomal protein L5